MCSTYYPTGPSTDAKKALGTDYQCKFCDCKEPLPQLALSNSVRAALASWAKSLSSDVGSQGITVNTVLTGYFNTERLRALNEAKVDATGQAFETVEQALIEKIPLRRLGDPTSYGALVTFFNVCTGKLYHRNYHSY